MLKVNVNKMLKVKKFLNLLIIPFIYGFLDTKKLLEIEKNIDCYSRVLLEINENYEEKINNNKLFIDTALYILSQLDKESYVYSSEKIFEEKEIGIELENIDEKFYVIKIKKDLKNVNEHLHVGGEILSINNEKISEELINSLDQNSETFELGFRSDEKGEIKKLKFKKKKKNKGLIFHKKIREDSLFLKIEEFKTGISEEVKEKIYNNIENLKNIIFDLRENGGGLIGECLDILKLFIPIDKEILKTVNKKKEILQVYKTDQEKQIENIKIFVIVDKKTASAAEIFAGIVQDLNLGVVLGEKTYGKGTFQVIKSISDDIKIKITNGFYLLPRGKLLQKGSEIQPDILIEKKKEPEIILELKKKLAFNRFICEIFSEKNNNKKIIDDNLILKFCNWSIKNLEIYSNNKVFFSLKSIIQKFEKNDQINNNIIQMQQLINKIIQKEMLKYKKEIKKKLEIAIDEYLYPYETLFEKNINNDPYIICINKILEKR